METVDVVIISDTTATVIWSPPIQPNGIITGYEVKYSVYGDDTDNQYSILATANVSSFSMTDLSKLYLCTYMYLIKVSNNVYMYIHNMIIHRVL